MLKQELSPEALPHNTVKKIIFLQPLTSQMLLLEVEDRKFGVMLEGVQRFVPQQFLDVVHVRPAPQQFCRTTAAERVGRDVNRNPRSPGIDMQLPQEGVIGVKLPASIHKYGLLTRRPHGNRPHRLDVAFQILKGCAAHRHEPFFSPLAQYLGGTAPDVPWWRGQAAFEWSPVRPPA